VLTLSIVYSLNLEDLRANDFTGKIPSELGKLTKLTSLQLHANELEGDMPSEICSLRTDEDLLDLTADCDLDDPFSKVNCEIDACCSECY